MDAMQRRGGSGAVASIFAAGLLLGCGGESRGFADEPHAALPGPINLRLTDELGQPIPATKVLVDGKVAVTDADGRATIDAVAATYAVAVVLDDTVASAFIGMTGRSPSLRLRGSPSSQAAAASVQVTNPDGLRDNERVFVMAGATNVRPDQQLVEAFDPPDGSTATVAWSDAPDVDVSAEAVVAELDDQGTRVVGYSAYAQTTLSLGSHDWVYWQPMLVPVPYAVGTIHVDTDASIDHFVYYDSTVVEASGAVGTSAFATGAAGNDLAVLDIPGAHYHVRASIDEGTGSYLAEQADVTVGASVHLRAGQAPTALEPEPGATVDLDTEFRFTAPEGSINRLELVTVDGMAPGIRYEIVTAALGVKLPDLSALGIDFPAGRKLAWYLTSELGHTSIERYASGESVTRSGFTTIREAIGASP